MDAICKELVICWQSIGSEKWSSIGIDEVESRRESWPGENLVMTGVGSMNSFFKTNALKPHAGSCNCDRQPFALFELSSVRRYQRETFFPDR